MANRFILLWLVGTTLSFGADVPNGLIRTGEAIATQTYEIVLAPQYTFSPKGTHLAAELRYQPTEDMGVGFAFGSGELGFNLGVYGVWHVLPDVKKQPAFAIIGGLYLNRIEDDNFFVVRLIPTVSETFRTKWGIVTPYTGLQFAPSFRLNDPDNELSLRISMGTQIGLDSIPGLRFWFEIGLGVLNSVHQITLGLSYPLSAFEG